MFERYKKNVTPVLTESLKSLTEREKICWDMARVFLENKDARGIHDMGVEIQALQRAITELSKL
jgi:hypothetical protein